MKTTSVWKSSYIRKLAIQTPYAWQLSIVDGYLLIESQKNNKSDSTFHHMCASKTTKNTQWIQTRSKMKEDTSNGVLIFLLFFSFFGFPSFFFWRKKCYAPHTTF
jgi:hypothetical protein